MAAHNALFWISLLTGVIALCAVTVFKITRPPAASESPQVADLPPDAAE